MIMLMGVALWVIAAPSGYVVGELAREHFTEDEDSVWLPWACAIIPPAAAAVALALILRQQLK